MSTYVHVPLSDLILRVRFVDECKSLQVKVQWIIQASAVFTSPSLWMKPLHVTDCVKATELYFHVVLFVMLYKLFLTFLSLWVKP